MSRRNLKTTTIHNTNQDSTSIDLFQSTNPLAPPIGMTRTSGAAENPTSRQNSYMATPVPRSAALAPPSPQYLSGGQRSLAGIGIRGFGLGIAFGLCALLTVQLIYLGQYIWRAPFFVAALAMFHYLEFDMTARFNPADAKIDSFLLTANGSAYNIAHGMAICEILIRSFCNSSYKPDWLRLPFSVPSSIPYVSSSCPTALGLLCIIVGQYARSAAMAKAGSSFNHLVQSTKRDDHVLITNGIYAFSRHPSYFGFFWWGLGTQLALGNYICFVAYAGVLWMFFAKRISTEEVFLVRFFGEDYTRYRTRTRVWIPFIR